MSLSSQPPGHLAAAVLQHHVHVLPVSKVSVQRDDVAVFQAAVQRDLAFHLQAWAHMSTPRGAQAQGHNPTPQGRALSGDPLRSVGPPGHGRSGPTLPRERSRAAPPPARGTTLRANTALVDMSTSL